MEVIDAKSKLKPEHLSKFLESSTDTEFTIVCKSDSILINRNQLIDKLLTIDVDDEDEVCVKSLTFELKVSGLDVNWWRANTRRKNKLLSVYSQKTQNTETHIESNVKYTIGVATLHEGQLSQISVYEGTAQELIKLVNEDIHKRYIDSFLKTEVVINLTYSEEEKDDIEQWMTLEELQEIGAIKL